MKFNQSSQIGEFVNPNQHRSSPISMYEFNQAFAHSSKSPSKFVPGDLDDEHGINVLCGVGILSTPYAAKEGGWVGLSILFIFGIISFYTGLLLLSCLDSEPGLETYPDIGQAAFGTTGRIAISIVLYVELYGCCIEYIILEGDNLASLFPNAYLNLGGIELSPQTLFAIVAALAVLPTVMLRDLSILVTSQVTLLFVQVMT
ncbi:Amino acid transporter avt1c [Trifolium repens]|nr:Amino acid transporter avt1c [Trifolium repens]